MSTAHRPGELLMTRVVAAAKAIRGIPDASQILPSGDRTPNLARAHDDLRDLVMPNGLASAAPKTSWEVSAFHALAILDSKPAGWDNVAYWLLRTSLREWLAVHPDPVWQRELDAMQVA